MNNINNFKWYRCTKRASDQSVQQAKALLKFNLPALYYELMNECDAGVPLKTDFEYYDNSYGSMLSQALGCFLGLEDSIYNLLKLFKNPPEFFPQSLVAFAETGNGDFICFDYRTNNTTDNPPIVYWNHEADVGKDVSFVAENFEAFLNMLKEPEDELLEEKIN